MRIFYKLIQLNMKVKNVFKNLLLLTAIGVATSFLMFVFLFALSNNTNSSLSVVKQIFMYTIGLPLWASFAIADKLTATLCDQAYQNTFGCSGGIAFYLSAVLYSLVFYLIYFTSNKMKKRDVK